MAHLLHFIADLDYGGAQTQLRCLTEEALRCGDRVTVASLRRPGPVGRALREAGAEVVWLRQRFAPDPLVLGRIKKLLRSAAPDAIQSWDLATGLYVRAAKAPCRWTHTIRESVAPIGWRRRAEAMLCSSAQQIIAPSEEVVASLVAQGARQDQIVVTPNVSDVKAKAFDHQAARSLLCEQLGLSYDAGPLLGAVGRWDSSTRGKEIAWAADLVRVLRPGVTLVIVGEGRAAAQCERFARKATEPGVVRFLGARSDWAALLGGFDVIWCASHSSSAPTPLVETMAAGRPVVAAEAPGREQLVTPGETGCLTRWDDRAGWARATERLLADPVLAERVGVAAAERIAKTHNLEQVAAMHREVLLG